MLLVRAAANFIGAYDHLLPVIWNACCMSSTLTLYLRQQPPCSWWDGYYNRLFFLTLQGC